VIIETFLDKLENLRRCGPGRWVACCPAHQGDGRSLSIREAESGAILLHCWAHGCTVTDITAAVGLTVGDLFPEKRAPSGKQDGRDHFGKPIRMPEHAHQHAALDALKSLHTETLIALIAAEHLRDGDGLDDADLERVTLAAHRIGIVAERVGALETADDAQALIRKRVMKRIERSAS